MKGKPLISILTAAVLAASAAANVPQQGMRTIDVLASTKPARPVVGENTLEVVISEGGQPVRGLRLTSSVSMKGMEMGTAHPTVKEVSAGRYRLSPTFSMAGPWRVLLVGTNPALSLSFDFSAGGRDAWKPVKLAVKIPVAGSAPEATALNEARPAAPGSKPTPSTPQPAKAEHYGDAMAMGQSAPSVPQLKERTAYAWTADADYATRTGFGKLEPMVRMMMLMMVTGSGMEGMKMPPMDMVFGDSNFTEDAAKEAPPTSFKPSDDLKVEARLDQARVGDNTITITLTKPGGGPVTGAKVEASVSMSGMDMGVTHPAVKEIGGKYVVKAKFGMAGAWRLSLTIHAAGVPAATSVLQFEVK